MQGRTRDIGNTIANIGAYVSAALFFGLIIWGMWSDHMRVRNDAHWESVCRELWPVVIEARSLINDCMSKGEVSECVLRGKAVVWNLRLAEEGGGQQRFLPLDLRADCSDGPLTLFMAAHEERTQVGTYHYDGGIFGPGAEACPAYQLQVDVCVVYWPERTPVGYHRVTGDPPYEGITRRWTRHQPDTVTGLPIWGPVMPNVLDWVVRQPKDEGSSPAGGHAPRRQPGEL